MKGKDKGRGVYFDSNNADTTSGGKVLNDLTNTGGVSIDLRGKKDLKLMDLNSLKIPLQDGKLWLKKNVKVMEVCFKNPDFCK